MTTELYTESIGLALRQRFSDRRFAAKLIARLGDSTERAARNWMDGTCGPQVAALILLMAREPTVESAFSALVQRQRELDARRMRGSGGAPP